MKKLFLPLLVTSAIVTACSDDDDCKFEAAKGTPAAVEAVDLGVVVNGKKVLWANMNVGAKSPTDYGGYFAWGETVSYGREDESNAENYSYTGGSYTKTDYSWRTYKYSKGYLQTKYVTSINSSFGYNKFYDSKIVLEPEDDAATVNWGADWRMPTLTELEALRLQCTWTWVTSYDGKDVKGFKVTGNGHEIFLPAANYHSLNYQSDIESCGYYWSSLLDESYPSKAWYLSFISGYLNPNDSGDRCIGFSVRPVRTAPN